MSSGNDNLKHSNFRNINGKEAAEEGKKITVIIKTARFHNSSSVIISSVSKAVQNCCFVVLVSFCTALLTLPMIIAESKSSKRRVLRIIVLYFSP